MPGDYAMLAERQRALKLEPLFPITSYTPESACPHAKRIKVGSRFVCMVCHSSGMDHLIRPGTKAEAEREEARRTKESEQQGQPPTVEVEASDATTQVAAKFKPKGRKGK